MVLNSQAFMDESHSGDEFILGGYIQTAEVWALFARDWEGMLPVGTVAKNGKRHFKMSEMAYFGKMNEVKQFYSIIEKHNLIPISCRLNMEDFHSAKNKMDDLSSRMGWKPNYGIWENKYFLTFRMMLNEFHLRKEVFESVIPLEEKIDFYFDNFSESVPILAALDEIRERMPEEIEKHFGANPRFENDQDFLGLQAADLWTWWVRRWYEEDCSPVPDKLNNFDFGTWRGKKRKYIWMSMTEDGIFEQLKMLAVENLAEGNVDPMTLARLRGEI